jgi:hypothetical protein
MALTAEQMVEELWEMLGEPTDIDPYDATGALDVTSTGWRKQLRALNRGVLAVATWKDPQRGTQFRFTSCFDWQDVAHVPTETTLNGATVADATTITVDAAGDADARNGFLVKVGNEVRVILDDSGTVLTLNKPLDQAHADEAAVYIAARYIDLNVSTTRFVEVLSVFDHSEERPLRPGQRGDLFNSRLNQEGDPREWFRLSSRVYLDRVRFDENRYFRVAYYKHPDEMTLYTDTSGLPEAFDHAVVLWAAGWGFARQVDLPTQNEYRVAFIAEMRQRQGELHVASAHDPERRAYVVVR